MARLLCMLCPVLGQNCNLVLVFSTHLPLFGHIFSCERKKQTLSGQLLALAQALMANTRGPTGGLRQSSVALLPPAGCGKVARILKKLFSFFAAFLLFSFL